jgi:7-dehydrocholesterol reductase
VAFNGSLTDLASYGLFNAIYEAWSLTFLGSQTAWTIIAVFAAVQIAFMKWLPGKPFEGPVTPKGNIPQYTANGPLAYFLTLALFCFTSFYLHLFPASIIYDNFGPILGALNLFSLLFCLFLYFKGRFYPSSTDSGISGNPIFDYYWGTELYPRLFGFDIKMFTNCRFGMMSWGLILISFAAKQQETYGLSDSMLVAVLLQLIYITKFFIWETGYLRSLDIMHDRAGYYICWGCLVWVPGVYTSSTLFLVNHPNHLGLPLAAAIFALGTLFILINYAADRQRQTVRATNGNCLVWGKKPSLTHVTYTTTTGEVKSNLLLTSGWWGLSRHFHYIPEILAALFWTLPALFISPLPYFYTLFLTILLTERAYRDDRRCSHKYGPGWTLYCEKVPYKIIPYVV